MRHQKWKCTLAAAFEPERSPPSMVGTAISQSWRGVARYRFYLLLTDRDCPIESNTLAFPVDLTCLLVFCNVVIPLCHPAALLLYRPRAAAATATFMSLIPRAFRSQKTGPTRRQAPPRLSSLKRSSQPAPTGSSSSSPAFTAPTTRA